NKDVYTHVTFADLDNLQDENPGSEYTAPRPQMLAVGDTMFSSNSIIVLTALDTHIDKVKYHLKADDVAVGALLKVIDVNDKSYTAEPIYIISNDVVQSIEAPLQALGLKFSFKRVDPEKHKVEISVSESKH